MNKLFQELTQSSTQTIANTIKQISNPKAFVNQYMNNPQVQSIINQYGNPKNAFYALAKQKGINPNEILKMIK